LAPHDETTPRYVALAEALRADIAGGMLEVGDLLPSEHALMAANGASRHTVREALRILTEAGLIVRKRGVGAQVVAKDRPPAFTQTLGGVDDLLQYARSARLAPQRVQIIHPGIAAARALGLPPRVAFARIDGIRVDDGGRTLAAATIYVREDLAPDMAELETVSGSVMEWISRTRGVKAARIEQSISAGMLTPREASALGVPGGGAGLRTRRRYLDTSGRVIAASDTVHPGDGFTYRMVLNREG
jgi:GntR family transcriptional regulator